MKRVVFIGVLALVFVGLAGCQTNTKQASQIYQKTEKAAAHEAAFDKSQDALNHTKKKEQKLYKQFLDLNASDMKKRKKDVKKARHYVDQQKELLADSKKQFAKSYADLKTIKENVDDIKNKKQKEKAKQMVKLLNKRKQRITVFYEDYQDKLALHNDFYKKLQKKTINADKIDKQIVKINKHEKKLANHIKQFNEATKQFNQAKGNYYKLADLKEKDLKKYAETKQKDKAS